MRFRHTVGKMSGGIRLSGGFYNTTIVRFKAVRFAAKKQPYDYVRLSGYFKSFTTICRYKFLKGTDNFFKVTTMRRYFFKKTYDFPARLYDYATINRLRLSAVKKSHTTIRRYCLRLYDYETLTTMRLIAIKARKQLVLRAGPHEYIARHPGRST